MLILYLLFIHVVVMNSFLHIGARMTFYADPSGFSFEKKKNGSDNCHTYSSCAKATISDKLYIKAGCLAISCLSSFEIPGRILSGPYICHSSFYEFLLKYLLLTLNLKDFLGLTSHTKKLQDKNFPNSSNAKNHLIFMP